MLLVLFVFVPSALFEAVFTHTDKQLVTRQVRALLEGLKPGDPVVLQLERCGELMYLAFTVE